jgi:hypothetical protein
MTLISLRTYRLFAGLVLRSEEEVGVPQDGQGGPLDVDQGLYARHQSFSTCWRNLRKVGPPRPCHPGRRLGPHRDDQPQADANGSPRPQTEQMNSQREPSSKEFGVASGRPVLEGRGFEERPMRHEVRSAPRKRDDQR